MTGRQRIRALLACDLDGTLLAADGSPAPGMVEALADLDGRGARVVVCTGRPLHGAAKAVAALRTVPVAYVCYHGALVVDAATGEWLMHLTISGDVVTGILEAARLLRLSVTTYEGDQRREPPPSASGAAPVAPAALGITRLVLSGDAAALEAALPQLAASWGRSTRLERAGGGTIAILPAAADKGEGLKLVAARLGVPLAQVAACGDSAADESLLRAAGVSIAVGAPPVTALSFADEQVTQAGLADLLLRRVDSLLKLA